MATAVPSVAWAMPFRDLTFSAARDGDGRAAFRLSYHGRAVTARIAARRATPVHCAGNVAVIHPPRRGRPEAGIFPQTVFAADVLGADGRARRVGGPAYRRAPEFPALLHYAGFSAFATRSAGGETFLVAAGSPAAALAVDPAVAAALPADCRCAIEADSARMRRAMAEAVSGGTPGAAAAAEIAGSPDWRCISGRGEDGDALVWAFSRDGGEYAVAGVVRAQATLTVQFPFLGRDAEYCAEWVDDGLDYYVRDGLEIRPRAVGASTRAVVKCADGGGFAVRIATRGRIRE